MRYFYRYANLLFFLGENELSVENYKAVEEIASKNDGKNVMLNERVAFLRGKALVGLAENSLGVISRDLNHVKYGHEGPAGENGFAKRSIIGALKNGRF